MEEHLKQHLDNQIASNKGKNLFYEKQEESMKFIRETHAAINKLAHIDKEAENILLDYVTSKVLEEFYRSNQYYTFDTIAKTGLRKIYSELLGLLKESEKDISNKELKKISAAHYQKLKQWLAETNPFAEKIYPLDNESVKDVPCSEYTPEIQVQILRLDISQLNEPVFDIGCGKSGQLVSFLRNKKINASGIDRLTENNPFCQSADWLEFDYGINKWGTIISHLGFSNHFMHHHLRTDGNFIAYARKYMEILNSLKTGGKFFYAPGLPFIEEHLDNGKFDLKQYDTGQHGFKSVTVTRMK